MQKCFLAYKYELKVFVIKLNFVFQFVFLHVLCGFLSFKVIKNHNKINLLRKLSLLFRNI